MDNIIVITQNVKLESLSILRKYVKCGSLTLVFSTHFPFENEKEIIEKELGTHCIFKTFGDFLSDQDYEDCDVLAYSDKQKDVNEYFNRIKNLKNEKVVKKVLAQYPVKNKIIVCDDLGIDAEVWIRNGFVFRKCEYYYQKTTSHHHLCSHLIKLVKRSLSIPKRIMGNTAYIAYYQKRKYVFYGSLNRIGYRLSLKFDKASKWENFKYLMIYLGANFFGFIPNNKTVRMSTLHEAGVWYFPDFFNLNLKILQDGYLPPNYSSKYLFFNGKNVEYYTWDIEGGRTFEYHGLKHRVIPFRNKLYLPKPRYPQKVKKVLCVASGAGDWTAVKNRSDEDKMIVAFGKVAKIFPDIEFIYRCHPVWIHPLHQGVNSINRAAEYIQWLNLPNLKISSNIPNAIEEGKFKLSYKRSSFEEDLENVNIVFGEHSISQIDAALNNIIFCSVNVTGRRDFFEGITKMGFPHCENIDEIAQLLNDVTTEKFKTNYENAINNYNNMTDKEA